MFLLALALLAAPAERGFDATAKGSTGLSFTVPVLSTGFLPGGIPAPTVGVTYFLQDGLAARLDFGLNAQFTPSAPATFDIGLALRFYTLRRDRVGVFLTPSFTVRRDVVAVITGPPGSLVAAVSLVPAVGVGAEYFFTDHFSAGGVLGLGLVIGNLGAPGDTSVGLQTSNSALFVSIYF